MNQPWVQLAPLFITAVSAVLVMLSIAVRRSRLVAGAISVLGLGIALITLILERLSPSSGALLPGFFAVDDFARFYMILILISSLVCMIFSYAYFKGFPDMAEEIYLLLLLATVGALMLPAARNLAVFFMGIELLSVPVYGLLAYSRQRSKSLESGLKYLILSASASATLLFGMAVLFAGAGTMNFAALGRIGLASPYIGVGSVMILAALAFKLSIAPFHQWVADVYQGAPAPITAFLATVAKVAVFSVAVRLIYSTGIVEHERLLTVLTALALASMLIGNLSALKQSDFMRILAFSSVAHIGYALTAIVSNAPEALTTANFYLASYVLTSIGAFGAITVIASPYTTAAETGTAARFVGLFWQRPWIASVFTVMFLSLAGFPMTAGFLAKLLVVFDAAREGEWLLLTALILGSGLGLYYYLKSVLLMYAVPKGRHFATMRRYWYLEIDGIILTLVLIFVLLVGIWPQPLISLSAMGRW